MIRVLHVLDKISINSGVSSVVMNYYSKMPPDIIFDFMLNEDVDSDTRAYIEGKGSKIYVMPGLKIKNLFKYISALRKFYRNTDYKIIHGHVANSAVFYLGLAKNVPVRIIHSHSTKGSDVAWKRIRNWVLIRFINVVANRYIACSDEAAAFLFGKKKHVTILHNAIDVNKFIFNEEMRSNIRNILDLDGKLVIGHVGRFSEVKNHSFLVEIFREVYKQNPNAALMLIGDGGLMYKVKDASKGLPVLFLGVKSDVQDYMSAMDVFVLPSLFEGLPLVVVEAQASGLPCLVSDRVPNAVDVTGNVKFLELKKDLWVRELTSTNTVKRTEQGQKVKGSRFDIEVQADCLVEYYRKFEQIAIQRG